MSQQLVKTLLSDASI